MQTLYTMQDEWGRFHAATAIEIQAVPRQFPPSFFSGALAGCEAQEASLEIACISDEGQRGARLVFILRQDGRNPRLISRDLNLRRQALAERLERMGFSLRTLDVDGCLALADRMAARRDAALCYPGENLRRVRFCYAPGGYDALMPIDLSELTDAVARHGGAGFSVQMLATRMLSREVELIRDNLAWLDTRMDNPEAMSAKKAFGAALSLSEGPLYYVSIIVWGGELAMQQMVSYMRQRGFTTHTLPMNLLSERDYLLEAPAALANYSARACHALARGIVLPKACERLNHLASPRLLGALLFPGNGMPAPRGLKVNRVPEDDAPLPPFLTGNGVALGKRASGAQAVSMPADRWARHAAVVGMPGTGKTTFLFQLLHQFSRLKIPFLAIEPTKTEYRALMEAIADLKVYTPGNSNVAPLMFNPFLPPPGVPLERYLPSLETAFLTAFSMHSPLDVIFPEVLRGCYTRYGWRMHSTSDSPEARPFGMRDFIAVFREEARQSGYDGESRANLESGGVYRFQSLLNTNGVLFDTDRPLPLGELLKRPVLIELDAIGNPEQKSLLLFLLMVQLNLAIRRDQAPDGHLKNVIMIDEAHVLLGRDGKTRDARDADPTGRAAAFLQQMVLENRAYGTGMIFADQSPGSLGTQIIGNADIQVMFRLSNADDRRMLGENLDLPRELTEAIEALPVGQCYLQAQGLERPIRLVTPDARADLGLKATLPDDAVRERYGRVPTPFNACACGHCDIGIRNEAEYIARSIADAHRQVLSDDQKAEEFIRRDMMRLLEQAVEGSANRDRLLNCAKMFLVRRVSDLIARGAQ